jgi:hypothetical protein
MDQLIRYDDLMLDRLEMQLIGTGDPSLTPLGLKKMRLTWACPRRQPDLYTEEVSHFCVSDRTASAAGAEFRGCTAEFTRGWQIV